MALTIITSNVNGIHDESKWLDQWQEIPCKDIICLQETHLTADQEYAFKLLVQSYFFFFSHGTSASAGLCTLVRRSSCVNAVKSGEIPGRLVVVEVIQYDGRLFHVLNVYAPVEPASRQTFFVALSAYYFSDVILLGDFNSVTMSCDRLLGRLDLTSHQLDNLLQA